MRSFIHKASLFATSLAFATLASALANAAPGDPIGQAIAIKNDVTAAFADDRRLLAKDDPVRQEEVIEVGVDSLGELKFKDDTLLALGPGSRMTLDKFVYDPDKTNGSIVVNLLKGTFRFITGLAAKPSYLIKTPSASISVRGTIFDVYIKPDGTTWLLLIEGAVEVCNTDGKCQVLDEPGKVIEVSEKPRKAKRAGGSNDGPGGWTVGTPVKWAALPGRKSTPIETAFPFVPAAPTFDPAPWYSANDIIIGRFPRHPRHPPRGDGKGNGKDEGKGDGKGRGDGPSPGRDTGTKPPASDKPPVLVNNDRPIKVTPPRVRDDDRPTKPKAERTRPGKPPVVKVVRQRDRTDLPVGKFKPNRDRSWGDKPFRRSDVDRTPRFVAPQFAPKVLVAKPSFIRPTPMPRFSSGGGNFGGGGHFGGGHGRR